MKKARNSLILVLLLVFAFSIPVYAAKPKLNKTSATITAGKTVQLKVKGTKAKVKWSSNNKSVATVSKNGKVKGIKEGTATITAKVAGKKLKCKVKVTASSSPSTSGGSVIIKSVTSKPYGFTMASYKATQIKSSPQYYQVTLTIKLNGNVQGDNNKLTCTIENRKTKERSSNYKKLSTWMDLGETIDITLLYFVTAGEYDLYIDYEKGQ